MLQTLVLLASIFMQQHMSQLDALVQSEGYGLLMTNYRTRLYDPKARRSGH